MCGVAVDSNMILVANFAQVNFYQVFSNTKEKNVLQYNIDLISAVQFSLILHRLSQCCV